MQIRAWSRKVVSVLRYFQLHPHVTLFGITGDIDNLGIYVAQNGRAAAEVLVDMYNRVIGLVYYSHIQSRPHEFFETCFMPSGEEVFILGTASDESAATAMFEHIKNQNIVSLLAENTPLDVGQTNITFGCSTFTRESTVLLVERLLSAIEEDDGFNANVTYLEILFKIRAELSVRLDIGKFSSLNVAEDEAVLFRNLVYLKTLLYKSETKTLLTDVGVKIRSSATGIKPLMDLVGGHYGLKNLDPNQISKALLDFLAE